VEGAEGGGEKSPIQNPKSKIDLVRRRRVEKLGGRGVVVLVVGEGRFRLGVWAGGMVRRDDNSIVGIDDANFIQV
jgi:hypothetical protein